VRFKILCVGYCELEYISQHFNNYKELETSYCSHNGLTMAALSEPRMVFSQWKKFLADFCFVCFYLTTLRMMMNSKFERIRKVGIVRNLRQYSGICLKELNKTTKCLIRRAALRVEIKNCRLKSSLISISVCVCVCVRACAFPHFYFVLFNVSLQNLV
jgi:hypothetical protein